MTKIAININLENLSSIYVPPVSRGIELISFLNHDKQKVQNNFVSGIQQNKVIHTPKIGKDSTEFSLNDGYVETIVNESPNVTLIALVNVNRIDNQMFISTYGADGDTFGVSLYSDKGGVKFAATRNLKSGDKSSTAANIPHSDANNSWRILIGRASNADNSNYLLDATHNINSRNGGGIERVTSKNATFRIGASYSPYFTGKAEIMAAIIHSVVLTENEIQVWVDRLRKYAGSKGIIV